MRNKTFLSFAVLGTLVLLFGLAACQSKTPESQAPAEQTAQIPPAQSENPPPDKAELQQKLQAQQAKIDALEKKLEQEKETARMQKELDRQRQELQKMKEQLAQEQTPPPAKEESAAAPATSESIPARSTEPVETRTKSNLVIPADTELVVGLQGSLSSKTNAPGDMFDTYLEKPLTVDGRTVLPANTRITGRIIDCKPSGNVRGKATMSIELRDIHVADQKIPVQTNQLQFEAQGSTGKDAAIIGGGGGLGAIIGGVIGGKKGAAIGALIGGSAGTAVVLKTPGKEVEFPPETRFQFVLRQPVTIED